MQRMESTSRQVAYLNEVVEKAKDELLQLMTSSI
jgi:hypothetical protein